MQLSSNPAAIIDVQVITPMRKGPTGTAHLNPMLQLLLNPPHPSRQELPRQGGASVLSLDGGQQHAHRIFRVGDRVIQQVNNYDKDVFNGDQGKVRRELGAMQPHLFVVLSLVLGCPARLEREVAPAGNSCYGAELLLLATRAMK